jgi:hypothetical protein
MLVDSDMERHTMERLLRIQRWLGAKRDLPVTIEKPMFDIGPPLEPGDNPRPPCIPDFILRAGRPGEAGRTVIAETMGFASDEYRARKERVHPLLSAALAAAPVVAHDFHLPADLAQERRDTAFCQTVRWALTGPEAQKGEAPTRTKFNSMTEDGRDGTAWRLAVRAPNR